LSHTIRRTKDVLGARLRVNGKSIFLVGGTLERSVGNASVNSQTIDTESMGDGSTLLSRMNTK